VLSEIRQDEQFHAVLLYLAVRGNVAAGNSGIDRYLSGVAASRREGNQVDGCLAAFALDVLNGIWRQIDLHRLPRWPVGATGLKNGMPDRGLIGVYDAPNPVGVQSLEANL